MGRPELADSAELATSELVTNAVLHARTFITLVVRAVDDEVHIEVGDRSSGQLSAVTARAPAGSLAAVGNGLHIIGALARRWGVHEAGPRGKTVWFVPASPDEERRADTRFPPDLIEESPSDCVPLVRVVLPDAPVRLLWQTRFRVRDLRREMVLLALHDNTLTGVPKRVVALAEEVDRVNATVLADDDDDFRRAVAADLATTTLRYDVPVTAAPACAELADLLDQADAYCQQAHLLTLAAPAPERAVRRWFLDQFAHQIQGEPPVPWHGQVKPLPAQA